MTDLAAVAPTAALIAAIALDEVAVGQFMLSQPIVGGWLIGWFLGDPAGGLTAGAFFQLLCLTELPVGSSVPPDGALAGLVGAAGFLLVPHPAGWSDVSILGLLCVGFLPVAYLGRAAEIQVRRTNRVWGGLAERLAAGGRTGLAQAAALGGIPLFFARGFIVSFAALALLLPTWGGARLEEAAGFARAMGLLGSAAPLIGLAALISQRRRSGWATALAGGAAAGVFIGRAAW